LQAHHQNSSCSTDETRSLKVRSIFPHYRRWSYSGLQQVLKKRSYGDDWSRLDVLPVTQPTVSSIEDTVKSHPRHRPLLTQQWTLEGGHKHHLHKLWDVSSKGLTFQYGYITVNSHIRLSRKPTPMVSRKLPPF